MNVQNSKNAYIYGVLILAIVVAALVFWSSRGPEVNADVEKLAACLASKNITMYGADWCPHCQNEKKAFGSSFSKIPYVECPADPQSCIDAGIKGYPTWIFPDGKRLEGEQGIQKLAEESGCSAEK